MTLIINKKTYEAGELIAYVEKLEKENAELKKSVNNWLKYEKETQYHKSIINDLKKELKDANEKVVHLACNQNKDLKYKLTKAKELLAKWVELYKPKIDTFLPTPIQVDTEQFLSEVEK